MLVEHALANCLNSLQHLLFIDLRRQLNVDVGTDAAVAKLANGCNISVGDYNPLAVQVNQHGVSESNAVNLADFIAQLHHFPDIERIRENQRETDHNILHKSLQAKTDR